MGGLRSYIRHVHYASYTKCNRYVWGKVEDLSNRKTFSHNKFNSTVCNKVPQHGYTFCCHLSWHLFLTKRTLCVHGNVETSWEIVGFRFKPRKKTSFYLLTHFRKGRMNIPLLYLHRYLRLTPLLVVSVLFSMSLLRFLGSGPLYPTMLKAFFGQCEKYWWSTLLYVQNYVNPSEMVLFNLSQQFFGFSQYFDFVFFSFV